LGLVLIWQGDESKAPLLGNKVNGLTCDLPAELAKPCLLERADAAMPFKGNDSSLRQF
jgi:hypothetical protein